MMRLLNDEQKKEFTNLVKNGTSPAVLSKHFNIGIASVHNYKNQLKEEGVSMPDIRGTRPSGLITGAGVIAPHNGPDSREKHNGKASPVPASANDLHITINGVSITISAKARSVHIGEGHIEVDF
jgi:hypothetical protein